MQASDSQGGLLWGNVCSGGMSALGGLLRGLCLVGGVVPGRGVSGIPACTEADTLPPVDRQTAVKTLPWLNFVAAGNK